MMILIPVLQMLGQLYGTQTSQFLLMETAKPLRGSEPPHCERLGAAEAQFCNTSGSSRSFYRNYSFYSSSTESLQNQIFLVFPPLLQQQDSALDKWAQQSAPENGTAPLIGNASWAPCTLRGSMGLFHHTQELLWRLEGCWALSWPSAQTDLHLGTEGVPWKHCPPLCCSWSNCKSNFSCKTSIKQEVMKLLSPLEVWPVLLFSELIITCAQEAGRVWRGHLVSTYHC